MLLDLFDPVKIAIDGCIYLVLRSFPLNQASPFGCLRQIEKDRSNQQRRGLSIIILYIYCSYYSYLFISAITIRLCKVCAFHFVSETMTFLHLFYFPVAAAGDSMRTSTSRVVTCLDIGVIVGAAVSSVVCSLRGLAQTKEMNRRLYEVRTDLKYYPH